MLSYLFQQVCSILLFGLWGELGIWDSFFFTEPDISDFSQMLPLLFSPPTSANLNSLALPMDLNSEFILLQLKAPHNWKKKKKITAPIDSYGPFCISLQGGGSVLVRLLPKWSSSSSSPASCRGSPSSLLPEFPPQTWTSALLFHLTLSPNPIKSVLSHALRAQICINSTWKCYDFFMISFGQHSQHCILMKVFSTSKPKCSFIFYLLWKDTSCGPELWSDWWLADQPNWLPNLG